MTAVFAGAGEVDALAAIHHAAFGNAAWSAATIGDSLAAGARAYLAADSPGHPPAAMALARFGGGESELLTIGVDPAARRRGLARALLEAIVEDARAAAATALILEVAADNAAARSLYADLRFAQVGARPFYYKRGRGASADALILRRALF